MFSIVRRLILQILAGILGFYLAIKFIPGVEFFGDLKILILAGVVFGLINFFLKPILKIITFPLRILTFGLFSIVINMTIVWIFTLIFPKMKIAGILPLFLTTLIILGLNLIFPLFLPKK